LSRSFLLAREESHLEKEHATKMLPLSYEEIICLCCNIGDILLSLESS
jgi:hypothetical protein